MECEQPSINQTSTELVSVLEQFPPYEGEDEASLLDEEESYHSLEEEDPRLQSCCPPLSTVIRNVESNARDHLANERTFLAWFRISIGIVGLGVMTLKSHEEKYEREAGILFILMGCSFIVYSYLRYYYAYFMYKHALISPNIFGLGFAVLLSILVSLAAFILVLGPEFMT